MRLALAATILAVAACAAAPKTASDAKPVAGAATKSELSGLPKWSDGDGDLAAAAAAMAKEEDFAKMREMMTPEQMAARSESSFENVQVLDGMTAQRFVGSMHGMGASLDVRCTFCHVPEHFESDVRVQKTRSGGRGERLPVFPFKDLLRRPDIESHRIIGPEACPMMVAR